MKPSSIAFPWIFWKRSGFCFIAARYADVNSSFSIALTKLLAVSMALMSNRLLTPSLRRGRAKSRSPWDGLLFAACLLVRSPLNHAIYRVFPGRRPSSNNLKSLVCERPWGELVSPRWLTWLDWNMWFASESQFSRRSSSCSSSSLTRRELAVTGSSSFSTFCVLRTSTYLSCWWHPA